MAVVTKKEEKGTHWTTYQLQVLQSFVTKKGRVIHLFKHDETEYKTTIYLNTTRRNTKQPSIRHNWVLFLTKKPKIIKLDGSGRFETATCVFKWILPCVNPEKDVLPIYFKPNVGIQWDCPLKSILQNTYVCTLLAMFGF